MSTPLQAEPLKSILLEVNDIQDGAHFIQWRRQFISVYETFLDGRESERATSAYNELSKDLTTLTKTIHKLTSFVESGHLSTERCSVKARQSISELQRSITVVAQQLVSLCPATKEEESKSGYGKFTMGAVLVTNNFSQYRQLDAARCEMEILSQGALKDVADRQVLSEITRYKSTLNMFCGIMSDLGLFALMKKCQEFHEEEKNNNAFVKPARMSRNEDSSLDGPAKVQMVNTERATPVNDNEEPPLVAPKKQSSPVISKKAKKPAESKGFEVQITEKQVAKLPKPSSLPERTSSSSSKADVTKFKSYYQGNNTQDWRIAKSLRGGDKSDGKSPANQQPKESVKKSPKVVTKRLSSESAKQNSLIPSTNAPGSKSVDSSDQEKFKEDSQAGYSAPQSKPSSSPKGLGENGAQRNIGSNAVPPKDIEDSDDDHSSVCSSGSDEDSDDSSVASSKSGEDSDDESTEATAECVSSISSEEAPSSTPLDDAESTAKNTSSDSAKPKSTDNMTSVTPHYAADENRTLPANTGMQDAHDGESDEESESPDTEDDSKAAPNQPDSEAPDSTSVSASLHSHSDTKEDDDPVVEPTCDSFDEEHSQKVTEQEIPSEVPKEGHEETTHSAQFNEETGGVSDILSELRKLNTACVSDADVTTKTGNDVGAYKPLKLLKGLRHLNPCRTIMAGVARTIQCTEAGDCLAVLNGLCNAQQDEVLVVNANNSEKAAAGESVCAEAARLGVTGIVIDGAMRESAYLSNYSTRVRCWSRTVSPISGTVNNLGQDQIPLVCGEVEIEPGQILMGDDDGILVGDRASFERILSTAQEFHAKGQMIKDALGNGIDLDSLTKVKEHIESVRKGNPSSLIKFIL